MATVLFTLMDWYDIGTMTVGVIFRGIQRTWETYDFWHGINLYNNYWTKRIKYIITEISNVLHVVRHPLHYSLKYDLYSLVWLLLKLGFNPNRDVDRPNLHPYPLAWANYDNPRAIRMLLEAGADLAASTNVHHNPLLRAMLVRNFETMELLLKYNVDMNCGWQTAKTALHKAIEIADTELIKWLKDHGAKNTGVRDVNTLLHEAIKSMNLDVLKLFLSDEFNRYIHWRDRSRNMPVHYMSWIVDVEVAEKLLNRVKGKVNRRDGEGYTMLHRAVLAKNVHQVKWLVRNGANIQAMTLISRETPLHLACKAQPYDPVIISFLVHNLADCNAESQQSYTPFHYAVQYTSALIVRDMIKHGADAAKMNMFGKSSCNFAACNKNFSDVILILEMIELAGGLAARPNTHWKLMEDTISGGCDDAVEYILRKIAYYRQWNEDVEHRFIFGKMNYCTSYAGKVLPTRIMKAQAILRYIAIAEYQNVYLQKEDNALIVNWEFKEYLDRCREELCEMQLTDISLAQGKLNLLRVVFDILLKGDKVVSTYAANKPLTEALFNHSWRFPIYFTSVTNAYQRDIKIRELRLRASKFISKTFGFNCYNHLVVQQITNYLGTNDLIAYQHVGDD